MSDKKGLHPAIAFALMVGMLCISLLLGANKAWTKKQQALSQCAAAAEEPLQLRVESAYNLLTVAGRYLPADNAQYAAVYQELQIMKNAANSLPERILACDRFVDQANALLSTLSQMSQVQSDERDCMYVKLMLPQAIEQCTNNAAFTSYDAAAQEFNDGLKSFSGLLAQLTGIKRAQTLSDGALMSVETVVPIEAY